MEQRALPQNVTRIQENEPFVFSCHPQVDCFTDCCKELELALTPYDVLRMKRETGLSSSAFLRNYVIVEQDQEDPFPRFYLTMVDDGNASCVFVSKEGCTIYPGRPGACRAYPMGRAATCQPDNSIQEFFVLLKEAHCHGFTEREEQTTEKYSEGQGLKKYNTFNDAVAKLLQHEKILQGMYLNDKQKELFTLALYDLDTFRNQLNDCKLPNHQQYTSNKEFYQDDEQLLLFAIEWLQLELFKQ